MSEETIQNEAENMEVASPQEQPVPVDNPDPQAQANDQERNFANLRSAKEEAERRAREAEEELRRLRMSQQQNAPSKQPEMADDDFITGADLKRWQQQQEIDATLRRYPDYQEIVNKYGNQMIKENPIWEKTILNSPNPPEAAYQMAKMYMQAKGLDTKAGEKTKENLQKPPTSSHGTPATSALHDMGNYQGLTKSKKDEIWRQAQLYASQR